MLCDFVFLVFLVLALAWSLQPSAVCVCKCVCVCVCVRARGHGRLGRPSSHAHTHTRTHVAQLTLAEKMELVHSDVMAQRTRLDQLLPQQFYPFNSKGQSLQAPSYDSTVFVHDGQSASLADSHNLVQLNKRSSGVPPSYSPKGGTNTPGVGNGGGEQQRSWRSGWGILGQSIEVDPFPPREQQVRRASSGAGTKTMPSVREV